MLTAKMLGHGGSGSVAHGEDVVVVLDLGGLGKDEGLVEGISKVWPSCRWGVAGEASGDGELRLHGQSRRFAGGFGASDYEQVHENQFSAWDRSSGGRNSPELML
jgi:hypothetical protein